MSALIIAIGVVVIVAAVIFRHRTTTIIDGRGTAAQQVERARKRAEEKARKEREAEDV